MSIDIQNLNGGIFKTNIFISMQRAQYLLRYELFISDCIHGYKGFKYNNIEGRIS